MNVEAEIESAEGEGCGSELTQRLIWRVRGMAIAAVSVTGWVNRLHFDRIVPALRTTVLTLTRQYEGN